MRGLRSKHREISDKEQIEEQLKRACFMLLPKYAMGKS